MGSSEEFSEDGKPGSWSSGSWVKRENMWEVQEG